MNLLLRDLLVVAAAGACVLLAVSIAAKLTDIFPVDCARDALAISCDRDLLTLQGK